MTRDTTEEQLWTRRLAGPGPVLAKFTAPWCAPCKAMEPHLERLEADPDVPPVVRIDVEQAPELAARFRVRAMPTLMLLQDGEPVASVVGLRTYPQMQAFLHNARALSD